MEENDGKEEKKRLNKEALCERLISYKTCHNCKHPIQKQCNLRKNVPKYLRFQKGRKAQFWTNFKIKSDWW